MSPNLYLFTWLCNETKARYEIITGKFESNKYIYTNKIGQSSLDNNESSVSLIQPATLRQEEMYIHTSTLRTINVLIWRNNRCRIWLRKATLAPNNPVSFK